MVVLALPRVVAFDLAIPVQVFGSDSDHSGRYTVTVAGLSPGIVSTTTGFGIAVTAGLGALAEADTVIVPGFGSGSVPESALAALRAAHRRGARIVSICVGAYALAEAGLLDRRRATTHWSYARELAQRYPDIDVDPTVLYVDEGDVLTSAGVAAGIDLCLHMVDVDYGEAAALEVARRMVTPVHRSGGQAQFTPPGPPGVDNELADVLTWALDHLDESLTVPDLAARALQSVRTFNRSFQAAVGMSPHAWLTSRRLRAACALLEDDQLSVGEVARRTGLGSAANFRLHFQRAFATTPSAYRGAFSRSRAH